MTDWQIGDLAECIRDDWESPGGAIEPTRPRIGDKRMVVDTDLVSEYCVECQRSHAKLGLSFIGGDGWFWESTRFRKIEPKGDDMVMREHEAALGA